MPAPASPPLVAVFSARLDRFRALSQLMAAAGVPSVGAVVPESGGFPGMHAFLARHDPAVVLYDLLAASEAPTLAGYAVGIAFFRQVQQAESAAGRRFVVLAAKPRAVADLFRTAAGLTVLAADAPPDQILAAVEQALQPALPPPSAGEANVPCHSETPPSS